MSARRLLAAVLLAGPACTLALGLDEAVDPGALDGSVDASADGGQDATQAETSVADTGPPDVSVFDVRDANVSADGGNDGGPVFGPVQDGCTFEIAPALGPHPCDSADPVLLAAGPDEATGAIEVAGGRLFWASADALSARLHTAQLRRGAPIGDCPGPPTPDLAYDRLGQSLWGGATPTPVKLPERALPSSARGLEAVSGGLLYLGTDGPAIQQRDGVGRPPSVARNGALALDAENEDVYWTLPSAGTRVGRLADASSSTRIADAVERLWFTDGKLFLAQTPGFCQLTDAGCSVTAGAGDVLELVARREVVYWAQAGAERGIFAQLPDGGTPRLHAGATGVGLTADDRHLFYAVDGALYCRSLLP